MTSRTVHYFDSATGTFKKVGSGDTIVQTAPPTAKMRCDFTAAATTAVGNVCYIDGTGKMALADADSIDSIEGIAIAEAVIQADASGSFTLGGLCVGLFDTGLTLNENDLVYISGTAGKLTNLPPSTGYDKAIGRVTSFADYSEDKVASFILVNHVAFEA